MRTFGKICNLKNIRHIIFDLGGVLLNIDYQRTQKAFYELGLTDFETHYTQMTQTGLFDDFETGRIGADAFVATLRELLPQTCTETAIINAWNAMLLDMPLRRLQLLQQLQIHYQTILLSNTNELHEKAFNQILKSQCGFNSFGVFFDKVYFSHRLGLRKPDKAIFELVLQQNQLDPEHTLYLDDSPQHIDSARQLGIQCIFMQPGMTIEQDVFRPKN